MNEIVISKEQRNVHIATEAAALLVVVPFSFWLGTRKELPPAARALALAIGLGTILVDGGLLLSYLKEPKA